MTTPASADREAIGDTANPLGLAGIEFIEYASAKPQALGQVLEQMGFRPIARHRSREVLLYRQGDMNIVINAHRSDLPRAALPAQTPAITAIALRVRDAASAWRRAIERGAWAAPAQVEPMELNIPALHGVGASRIYFVDRWRSSPGGADAEVRARAGSDFSIYDVDFVPIPTVEAHPPALAGLHWFGVVQYIGAERADDWTEFYRELFGFEPLADSERFGVLPKGRVLRSPDRRFWLQLVESTPAGPDTEADEHLQRVAFGTPDVIAAAALLRARGVEFVESAGVHTEPRGALTQGVLGGLMFELVQHQPA